MITINKTKDQNLTVVIKNAEHVFTVGKCTKAEGKPVVWQSFVAGDTMYIPAFDATKEFQGWAEISPAPKTVADVAALGYDVFEAALSAARVKIQSAIRAKTDGKTRIDAQMAELARQFFVGSIDEQTLKTRIAELSGNIVQL